HASTTVFLVPRIVRSPVTFSLPAEACSTLVDLKVIVGLFATSKNLSLFRSLSRSGWRVSTLFTSIVTSTVDLLTSLSSKLIVPLTVLKAPRTVDRPRWRTENCAEEWFGSSFHAVVAAGAGMAKAAASAAVIPRRANDWPIVFLLFCFVWIFVAKMLVASTAVGLLCGQKLIEGLDQTL